MLEGNEWHECKLHHASEWDEDLAGGIIKKGGGGTFAFQNIGKQKTIEEAKMQQRIELSWMESILFYFIFS